MQKQSAVLAVTYFHNEVPSLNRDRVLNTSLKLTIKKLLHAVSDYLFGANAIFSEKLIFPTPCYVDVRQMMSAQPAITCSKLTIEALDQGVKYVQS